MVRSSAAEFQPGDFARLAQALPEETQILTRALVGFHAWQEGWVKFLCQCQIGNTPGISYRSWEWVFVHTWTKGFAAESIKIAANLFNGVWTHLKKDGKSEKVLKCGNQYYHSHVLVCSHSPCLTFSPFGSYTIYSHKNPHKIAAACCCHLALERTQSTNAIPYRLW